MGMLFGTDGVRGRANLHPMTTEMAMKIGRASASFFKGDFIVIGKDTRISGDMLEAALISGICSMGKDVYLAGVIPTPGVSYLASNMNAAAGIVISASHNPYFDNGIKLFRGDGFKLSDEQEMELETLILSDELENLCIEVENTGRVHVIEDSVLQYADFIKGVISPENNFNGLKAVIDCSNGATSKVAPELFRQLGMVVEEMFVDPDGININDNCGSEHPEKMAKKVKELQSDIGLAFDGDGDRLIAVDENGKVISGDQVIAICANHAKNSGKLKNNTVVTTVMSNMGLGAALQDMNVKHVMSGVGDRKVMHEMIENNSVIGGEDSGHMIFMEHHTTGDGILSAVKLLEVMHDTKKKLSELSGIMDIFPQVLINIDVKEKPEISSVPDIVRIINEVEGELGDKGRVLVRYSGTQPMCRVMTEGPSLEETERSCRKIADVIKEVIGQ